MELVKKVLFFGALLSANLTFAQNPVTSDSIQKTRDTLSATTDLQVAPQFPGGESGLMEFIKNNLKYPRKAKRKGIQGVVVMTFVVEKDGKVSTVTVAKGVHPLLDNECMRVMQAMPQWTPGFSGEKPVKVRYSLPLTFKIK